MIDLSLLPAPDIIEMLDFEAILDARKARLVSLYPIEQQEAIAARLALESDPTAKMLQESAYRELVLRQRINDAAKASLLAYATGADLDNRAADYGVQRLVITPADLTAVPPVAAVMEDDEALRYRTRLSLEALSVAGSRGAYEFHGLSASASIANISVDSPTFVAAQISPALQAQLPAGAIVLVCDYPAGLSNPLPGDVSLAVLPSLNSQIPAADLVQLVQQALSAEDVRPITDRPRALAGQATDYAVTAVLELEAGPDPVVVKAASRAKLDVLIAQSRQLEGELPVSAIYAALHVPGVRRVRLTKPAADVVCDKRHFPNCTSISLNAEVAA
ncbi:baseplate J/gp47 family protein [Pseudomonas asiatica]|uniref:baseplate assembly protein n=1 Tax=Pseudomonas asiatica TaxID=2219225 RepID=UPI00209B97BD|nr:baseplate J/gp47 family protein [Pseudomonas asiatica]MCO7538335.1 baseplate J/gp47 family protein [Pseudomonas asiatica]MCO7552223.1 baseplate J/gp47 family protein [Pseudomonas asiatica]MCO7563282.1 baseplate J/gp47 family protein [Pseudomonas asiatica]